MGAPLNPPIASSFGGAWSAKPAGTASRAYRLLGNLLIALALVGFPLAAGFSELRGTQTNELNIAYRATVVLLCGVMIAWSASRGHYRIDGLIALFFTAYSVRLIVDSNNTLFPNITNDGLFFASTVLAPTLAMGGARHWLDESMLLRLTLVIGTLGGALLAALLQSDAVVQGLALQGQDRATLFFLNPISIGYHGLFIAMSAVMLIGKNRFWFWMMLSAIGVVLGTYLMLSSGSRGPFVALTASLIILGLARLRSSGGFVVVILIVGAAIARFGLADAVVNRFLAVGADETSFERVYAINQSISLALSNPLFGYAYIEPATGFYPHNLIVESALALGLAGATIMVWMQWSMLANAWRHARNGAIELPFLGVSMIANAWISGSIWGSTLFFMVLWMLREIPASHKANQGAPEPAKSGGR